MAVVQSVMPTATGLTRYWIADTEAELPVVAPAADGDLGYAKDTDQEYSYNGTTWTAIGGGGGSSNNYFPGGWT